MKRTLFSALLLLGASFSSANAAGGGDTLMINQPWSFEGVRGKVDKPSARRGLEVYRTVCASCHGLKRIRFRELMALGYSEKQAKAIAAEYQVEDGPNDDGDMFERAAILPDSFPSPFPNKKAARAANGGAFPPDLSLMIKARPNGANYVYSLMTSYGMEVPEEYKLQEGLHYNPAFPGGQIAMPQPLTEGLVEYTDGTEASIEQMSKDVVNFLQWAAEPEMERRKEMGVRVMIFLSIMTLFFYIAKRRIWRDVH